MPSLNLEKLVTCGVIRSFNYFIRMVFPSSHHMKCNLCTPGHLKPKPLLNCVGFRSNYMLYTYLIWDRNLYIFG